MISVFKPWHRLAERLDQRSLRERWIVMVAMLAVTGLLFEVLWLGPQMRVLRSLQEANRTQVDQQHELLVHLQLQRQQVQVNVNTALEAKKQQLLKDLAAQQQLLLASDRNMLSPESVVGLLQALLRSYSGLQTLSLRNLKPEPAVQPPEQEVRIDASVPAQATVLWRHGVELRLRGSYADIVSYLQQLERQRPHLHWQSLRLLNETDAALGHVIVATLVISTLSLETPWLAI